MAARAATALVAAAPAAEPRRRPRACGRVVGPPHQRGLLVPLSETLERLASCARSGALLRADSRARLGSSSPAFALAIVVGAPFGMLLARVPVLRAALDVYIMVLYATPMVALIPFILSLMGFGFAPKVLVVFLFAVFPVLYNTVEGARSLKPELDRGRALVPLERMGAVARGDGALHLALRDDRRAPGHRPRARRHGRGRVLPELDRPRPAHHERVAEFRHRAACSPRSSSSARSASALMRLGRVIESTASRAGAREASARAARRRRARPPARLGALLFGPRVVAGVGHSPGCGKRSCGSSRRPMSRARRRRRRRFRTSSSIRAFLHGRRGDARRGRRGARHRDRASARSLGLAIGRSVVDRPRAPAVGQRLLRACR